VRCAKCGAENPKGLKFCDQCAAPFKRLCAKCGFENSPAARFCGECAAPLKSPPGTASPLRPVARAELPESISQSPADHPSPELDGERKTVTALFADIKGSMDLIEDLDPEEARAIVDPALKLMMEAVQRYGGYVAQSTGDGIFALFGAPVAHEDHPQRAVLAAIRTQAEVKRYADKLRAEKGVNIQVRVGANTGEVVVREIRTGEKHAEYLPIGHSASVAARLQGLATPGSIAISDALHKLVDGYFVLKPLGPARIKGVSEPLEIFEVTGLGPLRTHFQISARRGLTRFVGRDAEMAALDRAAELVKSGHGQIVAVVGEPGVGKSRLFFEFKARHQAGWKQLEAFSVSHGKTASFMPLNELLKKYFGIDESDETRIGREKIAGRIAMLDRRLEDTLPYLFGLLGFNEGEDQLTGMNANIRRRRTLDAINRILVRASKTQPLIVILEDLHWIDDETQALLNLFAESIGDSPILLALNYRPEYRHDWGTRASFTQIRLEPLKHEFADEMLGAMLGDDLSVVPLRKLIIEKSGATPFFIEEMVQTLFEEGVLTRNGAVRATKSVTDIICRPR
jgi:class 3 adenylate cyclase